MNTEKNYIEIVKVLTALEHKILATKIQEDGTARIVVSMQDLDALDDAIKYIDLTAATSQYWDGMY